MFFLIIEKTLSVYLVFHIHGSVGYLLMVHSSISVIHIYHYMMHRGSYRISVNLHIYLAFRSKIAFGEQFDAVVNGEITGSSVF